MPAFILALFAHPVGDFSPIPSAPSGHALPVAGDMPDTANEDLTIRNTMVNYSGNDTR